MGPQLCQDGGLRLGVNPGCFISGLFHRVSERGLESLAIEGFEQVLDRMDLEGPQGELVISGHKHDYRHRPTHQGLEHTEPVQFRHLDIQKHQVG